MFCVPYFIGAFIPSSNSYGAFFLYGIFFFNGEFVPLADTWLQGLHELCYSYIPLVIYLSFCCTRPERLYWEGNFRQAHPVHKRWYVRLFVFWCCILLISSTCLYQASQAFTPGLFYGWIAVIISPGKSWFVAWACWIILKKAVTDDDAKPIKTT